MIHVYLGNLIGFSFWYVAPFNLILADQSDSICAKSTKHWFTAHFKNFVHLFCFQAMWKYHLKGGMTWNELRGLSYLEQAGPRRPLALCLKCCFSRTVGSYCTGQPSPAELWETFKFHLSRVKALIYMHIHKHSSHKRKKKHPMWHSDILAFYNLQKKSNLP